MKIFALTSIISNCHKRNFEKCLRVSKKIASGGYHFVLRTLNMPILLSLRGRALDEKALDLLPHSYFPFLVICPRPPQFPYLVYWDRAGWVFKKPSIGINLIFLFFYKAR